MMAGLLPAGLCQITPVDQKGEKRGDIPVAGPLATAIHTRLNQNKAPRRASGTRVDVGIFEQIM
jgi:hypothetical protein